MLARMLAATLGVSTALGVASYAHAAMILSQVVIDLWPGRAARGDIEVWNDGDERLYVSAEPFEIRIPGGPGVERVPVGTPEESGILISPRNMVLEPGERRTIRIAAIGERAASDRVYRVAIKPTAGPAPGDASALKVVVGYDALVIVRPERVTDDIQGHRTGRTLLLFNGGNTAQELLDGRQCDNSGGNCQALPAKRLYPGASWEQPLPFDTEVSYRSVAGSMTRERRF
jgi:Mat/Ecp fimbriae periplasmic chaperone